MCQERATRRQVFSKLKSGRWPNAQWLAERIVKAGRWTRKAKDKTWGLFGREKQDTKHGCKQQNARVLKNAKHGCKKTQNMGVSNTKHTGQTRHGLQRKVQHLFGMTPARKRLGLPETEPVYGCGSKIASQGHAGCSLWLHLRTGAILVHAFFPPPVPHVCHGRATCKFSRVTGDCHAFLKMHAMNTASRLLRSSASGRRR